MAGAIDADTGYGSAEMLNWLVHERGIEPHIPVFDKSKRTDGTFSREDFTYDHASDTYRCPAGKILQHYRRRFTTPRTGVSKDNLIRYRANARLRAMPAEATLLSQCSRPQGAALDLRRRA